MKCRKKLEKENIILLSTLIAIKKKLTILVDKKNSELEIKHCDEIQILLDVVSINLRKIEGLNEDSGGY